jgi:hypothetical protein
VSMGLFMSNHIDTSPQSVRYITLRAGGMHADACIPLIWLQQKQHYYGISSMTNLTFFDTPSVTRAMTYGAHIARLTPNVFFPPT